MDTTIARAPSSPDEALQIAKEISDILGTGLSREELAILMSLTEQGLNPDALAAVVEELRREASNNLAL